MLSHNVLQQQQLTSPFMCGHAVSWHNNITILIYSRSSCCVKTILPQTSWSSLMRRQQLLPSQEVCSLCVCVRHQTFSESGVPTESKSSSWEELTLMMSL